jgi:hypothetical protein
MVVINPKEAFFSKIDGPLSALACNCLQLTCMLPSRDSYCTYQSTADTSNWMGQLVASSSIAATTMTLRDMVLPGSHDSASGTIGPCKPFSAAGRTQNVSVGQQLQAGARYLDIRVAASSKSKDLLSIWHGCLEGGKFEDVLQEVSDFVQNHVKEVVIVELVPEFGKAFDVGQRIRCLDVAYELLSADTIIPGDQVREIIENKPFAEVAGQKQRVVVLLHDRFFEGEGMGMTDAEITAKYGFVKSGEFMRNPWNDTRDPKELMAKNLQTVEECEAARDRLVSNQFMATPGVGSISDVVGALTGKNSLRPVSHACRLYKAGVLDRFLCQNADKAWNIVALDFVDLCPDIVDFLIALNWKLVTMKILFAAVCVDGKDQNVTAKVQSFLCRDCVLFLVDPDEDLGTGAERFTLSVAYSLSCDSGGKNNRQYHVTFVDVGCDCPILISPFCANEGSVQVEVTDDNGATGVVHRGKTYTTKAEVPGGMNGTALEYNIDGANKCEFSMV